MKRTNFYITDNQTIDLRKISEKTGMSVSEHVRRALDIYINAWSKTNAPEPAVPVQPEPIPEPAHARDPEPAGPRGNDDLAGGIIQGQHE